MFGVSRLVALILAFTLGFSVCGGVLVGGIGIALGTFRVRDIEKHGLADIPDELFMGENPEVDLLNLTAFEFVDELKTIYGMGDSFSIKLLEERYAIKIPSAANKFLTDEAKAMPVKSLFSEQGIKSLLSTVYIGYVQSFECHAIDSSEPGDPSLGEDNARWFNPTTGEYVTGINETLAFISLGDFVSGKVDVTAVIGGLHIGEALGYYPEIDEDGNEVWCDGTTGKPVTGVMGVFAGCTVDDIDTKINDVTIGELLGYYEKDGEWYQTVDDKEEKVTGVITVFADCKIDEIGDKINDAKVGELLGYYEKDGVWYQTVDDKEEKVTGIMAVLAPSPISKVGDTINNSSVGQLLGYEQIGDDWYKQNEETGEFDEKVTGIMAVLAPSPIDKVGNTIEESSLGELLGYYEKDGEWYQTVDGTEEKVTGVMSVIADSPMDEAGNTINNSTVGKLLGYTKGDDGKWYEYDEIKGEDVEVSGFMNAIANEQMNSIGDAFDKLTVGDMVAEEDRTGIFSILDPTTPINDIAGSINDSIMQSPMQFFMNEGLIDFDSDMQNNLDTISSVKEAYVTIAESDENFKKYYEGKGDWTKVGDSYLIPEWRTQMLSASFSYIVNLLMDTNP